jgi:rod shape-determining protein MreC
MHNLLAFFRRFRVFMFFVLLQILALSTYFTYLHFPRSQYLTSASTVSAFLLETRNDLTKHWNLGDNNKLLQHENVKLRENNPISFMRLERNLTKINDTLFEQQYSYIPAAVINSTCHKRNNYFTINVGRKQGVKVEMGVFSDNGIIGIIHNTSDHYSVVKSVLTEGINVDVIIEPSGAYGLLKWDGKDPKRGSISGISNDIKIDKWSPVVTRGGSGIFPRGLSIGKIESLKPIEGEPLWNVTFLYSENYRSIQNVYVVKNLLRKEQKELEKLIPEEKTN